MCCVTGSRVHLSLTLQPVWTAVDWSSQPGFGGSTGSWNRANRVGPGVAPRWAWSGRTGPGRLVSSPPPVAPGHSPPGLAPLQTEPWEKTHPWRTSLIISERDESWGLGFHWPRTAWIMSPCSTDGTTGPGRSCRNRTTTSHRVDTSSWSRSKKIHWV